MANRIVITGATGFLGRYIVEELGNLGEEVYAIIRPESSSRDMYKQTPFITTVIAELDDTARWEAEIGNADYFIHLGWAGTSIAGRAQTDVQQKNVEDTIKCINAAKRLGCKAFLFAGSQAEYGIKDDIITEQAECNPILEYGKAKLEVLRQALLQDMGDMKYYHARIFSVYGKGDHKRTLVQSCIRTLCDGGEMELSACKQYWNFLYAADAAYEICSLIKSGAKSGIYNIASRDTRPLRDFVDELYELCESNGKLLFGVYDPEKKPASLQPDISRLESAIGKIPYTPFKSAIKDMINTYKTTGEQ